MKKKYGMVVVLLLASYALVAVMVSARDDAELILPPNPTISELTELQSNWVTLDALNRGEEPLECEGATPNLLGNPSFEGQYGDYVPNPPIPDCPWGVCFSAQMAPEWTPYWQSNRPGIDEGWEFLMPEYKPASSDFTDPSRVRSGQWAQQLFTFWGTHRAGIYQQVYNVEPGQNYCLSVWGHSWSGATDNAYTDPNDHGFLNQSIGIDPFGGQSYLGNNIIWTQPTTQYDEYGLFKLEVEAQSDTITIFFNSQPLWPKKHNDVYWDDAILVRTGVAEPPVMTVDPAWLGYSAETAIPVKTSSTIDVVIENNYDNLWYTTSVMPQSEFTPTVTPLGPKVTIAVDSTGLPAGTHRATVEVLASDDTIEGGRQYVTVQIDVAQSAPEVDVLGDRYGFIMDDDALGAEFGALKVELKNIEQLPNAAWSAAVDGSRSDFFPTLVKSWGQNGDMIEFLVDGSDFEVGSYTAWVDVSGNDATFSNVDSFSITLIVAEEISNTFLPAISR